VLDSATGVLSGTATAAGVFSFTVTATDADSVQVSKSYTVTIAGPADLCAGVVCSAADACHQAGICDPATGLCSDPPAPDGSPCDDGDICTMSDTCEAGSCTGAGANPVCGSADIKLQLRVHKKTKLGPTIDYRLQIRNRGPDAAAAVVARLTCSGVAFHITMASSGCAAEASTVTCALGMLTAKQSAAIAITLVPDAPGLVTCTADVSSATFDPVPTNQTRTRETKVR
jgi:hypothetical protein